MAQKGNIGVTTENIFPVIKKFLYSDHDIFLREMVSNAVDATQKLKTLAAQGDFKGEIGDTTVRVSLDENAGTLTFSDHGIGMTEEEIDKYLFQVLLISLINIRRMPMLSLVTSDSVSILLSWFPTRWKSLPRATKKVLKP